MTQIGECGVIELWSPGTRCLGGVCLGDTAELVLLSGDYVRDETAGSETQCLQRSDPDVMVTLSDDIVVSITAFDECLVDGVNVIGLPLDAVAWRLGGVSEQTGQGEVDMFQTASGVEIWIRDGSVCQLSISDWSLIQD
jgi:hypothetical protein